MLFPRRACELTYNGIGLKAILERWDPITLHSATPCGSLQTRKFAEKRGITLGPNCLGHECLRKCCLFHYITQRRSGQESCDYSKPLPLQSVWLPREFERTVEETAVPSRSYGRAPTLQYATQDCWTSRGLRRGRYATGVRWGVAGSLDFRSPN